MRNIVIKGHHKFINSSFLQAEVFRPDQLGILRPTPNLLITFENIQTIHKTAIVVSSLQAYVMPLVIFRSIWRQDMA